MGVGKGFKAGQQIIGFEVASTEIAERLINVKDSIFKKV